MTELERARAHLRECQHILHECRSCGWLDVEHDERNVLAALSLAWEAQEAARIDALDRMLEITGMRRFSGVIPKTDATLTLTIEPGADVGTVSYAAS